MSEHTFLVSFKAYLHAAGYIRLRNETFYSWRLFIGAMELVKHTRTLFVLLNIGKFPSLLYTASFNSIYSFGLFVTASRTRFIDCPPVLLVLPHPLHRPLRPRARRLSPQPLNHPVDWWRLAGPA